MKAAIGGRTAPRPQTVRWTRASPRPWRANTAAWTAARVDREAGNTPAPPTEFAPPFAAFANAPEADWLIGADGPRHQAADRALSALANMAPGDARRVMDWNASAEGRRRNDAVMAAWARASDAAAEAMLVDAFEQGRDAIRAP